MATLHRVDVASLGEIDRAITMFLAQGYVLASRTATTATMQKRKQFSIAWAVFGIVFCVLPLLIYMIIYAVEEDVRIVEIVAPSPLLELGHGT